MPSFDIVSKIDMQEVENAVNQARKELSTRYDFRGSKSRIDWDKEKINLVADDEFKMRQLVDMLKEKAVRRSIDARALDVGKSEEGLGGLMKCEIKLKQGVPVETAREMIKEIKASKMKVQAQIQDDQLRVTGKKRDDLQEAIALIKSKSYDLPLQFINFRE
ncbi:MAG TPA: YajQ family cyclic di-GMP-binding protein [bacterium]|nr:YajQ family cyclic di-GMP-binding protein [bacterium]